MIDTFFERLFSEYADIVGSFAIPMIIAIFAFAFPLLFQIASRIDDKYNSTLLIKVFRKDWICKWFISILICALICSILWVLQIPRYVDWGKTVNNLIDNSALILLVLSTLTLVVLTIGVMQLTYIYYMPNKLLVRLIKQYSSASQHSELYFEAISKILFYSIKKEGEPLARQLQEFYWEEITSFRKGKENTIIDYPDYVYNVLFDANERLCQRERKSISLYNSSFYDLFIDEYQHTIISEKTFKFIWKCLYQSVFYKKDEFIISYWHKAHQYMNFWLNKINPQYDDNFNSIINRSEIDKKNKERERFIEFHYALGGLLMMKERYSLLNQLIFWTNQIPPKYVLVPETMKEVITRFMQVELKVGYLNPVYYEQRYPFLDVFDVNADNIIKMWIKRYIAILFLRQYILHEYYTYSRTLELPNPPQTLTEKRKWIEELDILKRFVNEYLSDEKCLKALNMEMLYSPNWFTDNKKLNPDKLIDKLKKDVDYSAEQTKANQEIDENKKQQFFDATKQALGNCFEHYAQLLTNVINDNEPHKSLFYGGRYEIMDKMAFAADQDMGYSNTNRITADLVATEFNYNFPSIFKRYYNLSFYRLKEKDLFSVIDKLHLDSKQFIIVSVGINLNEYKTFYVNNGLNENQGEWKYKNIPIIELQYSPIEIVGKSLYIMKNEDLPCIVHNKVKRQSIEKYKLEKIDDKYHIYTNLIDLNKDEAIRNEVAEKTKIQDLTKFVLVCVDVNTEIRCKMNVKCIQLKEFSQFADQGNPNTIDEVTCIWNDDK